MRFLAVFLLLAFIAPAAFAQHSAVARVEHYLSSLTTVMADFTQVAADGTISSGKFYLKRPKQMLWQYAPPVPVLMVTRGSYLTYYDYSLKQVSDIPLEDTLLSVLSNGQVNFARDGIAISGIQQEPGFLRLTLKQQGAPEDGALTLEFSDAPLLLRNLRITDATGQTTVVTLENTQFGVPLSDKLFAFKDPRIGGTRKKRPN